MTAMPDLRAAASAADPGATRHANCAFSWHSSFVHQASLASGGGGGGGSVGGESGEGGEGGGGLGTHWKPLNTF